MKSKLNIKGFTLIELLAVMALLSVVISVTLYTVTNVLSKAKEKTYAVTISNIEKEANSYLIENKSNLSFVSNSDNTEYACVTVENLIDKGYLNNDVINSPVDDNYNVEADNYIYVLRNKSTKAIIKSVYIKDSSSPYNNICSVITNRTNGIIDFKVEPGNDIWAREKKVTITYKAKNVNNVNLLTYYYKYLTDEVGDNNKEKELIVSENGSIYADIKYNNEIIVTSTKEITKIDIIGPVVKLGTINTRYVSKTATLPLIVTDSESGVKYTSFTEDDIIVTIGGEIVSNDKITLTHGSGNNYSLKIDDTIDNGPVVITVKENGIQDNVGNNNQEVVLRPTIDYDNEKPVSSIETTSNLKVTSQTATLKCSDNVGVASYYWGTTAPTATTTYTSITETKNFSTTRTISSAGTYYLSCRDSAGSASTTVNKVYHTYKVNNMLNTTTGTAGTYTTANYSQASTNTYLAPKGTSLVWTNIYTIPTGSHAGRFRGASSGAASTTAASPSTASVTLNSNSTYSTWFTRNGVLIKYVVQSGEGFKQGTYDTTNTWTKDSSGNVLKNGSIYYHYLRYGATELNLIDNKADGYFNITKTNYLPKPNAQWKCLSGCKTSGQTFSQATITVNPSNICSNIATADCTVSLVVNWAKTINVTYNKNDGSGSTASQTFTSGASGNRFGYNNDGTPKWSQTGQFGNWDRSGYTLLGWSTNKNATAKEWNVYSNVSDGWIAEHWPSITLYAIWKRTTYTCTHAYDACTSGTPIFGACYQSHGACGANCGCAGRVSGGICYSYIMDYNTCSTGTRTNGKCYLYNQTSCPSGWTRA